MKRLLAFFIISALLFALSACGSDAPSAPLVDVGASPALSGADSIGSDAAAFNAENGKTPAARVDDTAAAIYNGTEGITLYGAAAYTNTGDCPIIIESAVFTFTAGGETFKHSFVPPLAEYAVLMPGETSFLTAWVPQASETALSAGMEVSLSVSLTPRRAEAARTLLLVDRLYLADNYPNFTTLSGRITCAGALGCEMNIIHIGFYDAEGTFLGAWYFTKNTLLEGEESKNFVVQMHGLPLDSLAERANSVSAIGFGFTL